MTTGPEHPGGQEFAPPDGARQPDPYAPVDYPANPGLPPPVYGAGYPPPPGFGPPPPYPPAYGYGYGYGGYAPHGQPTGVNGKAVAALVTSLVGLVFCGVPSIVGLILGVVAMRETRRTGQEGFGLALAGAIVGGLVVAGWTLYVVLIIGIVSSGVSVV